MLRAAVAGNPNSGKTSIFNRLSGEMQAVGNYPGVTVDLFEGAFEYENETVKLVDLPGIYSLSAYSQEELVARNFILREKPDIIINVVDASNLERNLYLTTQLIEFGLPMVLVLNMMDVAEKKGCVIDIARLSKLLGVKVIQSVASRDEGIEEIKTACLETMREKTFPKPLVYSHELQESLSIIEKEIIALPDFARGRQPRWLAIRILESDSELKHELAHFPLSAKLQKSFEAVSKHINTHSGETPAAVIVESRYAIIAGLLREATRNAGSAENLLSGRIDSIVCGRYTGPLILLAVVYALFAFVFKISDDLKWIPLFNGEWESPVGVFEFFFDSMSGWASAHIESKLLLSLINDAVIGGVGGVMSFVPLIFFMFLSIAVLEDTGYIARVAFILDRVLRSFGLQGKSILAMIISGGLGGGGCAVPGVMAARTLREEKDRLVTILVAPMMNCGAKMPVYAMLIAAFFSKFQGGMMFILWLLSWVFALSAAFFLRKVIIRGEQTPFVMELPVYHVPRLTGIVMHTWYRTFMYIKKAATVILGVNIILWTLMYFPQYNSKPFETARDKAVAELNKVSGKTQFTDKDIELLDSYLSAKTSAEKSKIEASAGKEFEAVSVLAKTIETDGGSAVAVAFNECRSSLAEISHKEAAERLKNSFAGRIGTAMTPVSMLAGFDWRENIALIGGWAAKELVLGTLGTAYSMGEVKKGEGASLSEKLSAAKDWSPLKAFVLMVFVMVYAPCLVTIVTIRRETGSWKWALFSTIFSTAFGFILAVLIYQAGRLIPG